MTWTTIISGYLLQVSFCACGLLLLTALACRFTSQPIRRIRTVQTALLGVVLMLPLVAIPGLPRIHLGWCSEATLDESSLDRMSERDPTIPSSRENTGIDSEQPAPPSEVSVPENDREPSENTTLNISDAIPSGRTQTPTAEDAVSAPSYVETASSDLSEPPASVQIRKSDPDSSEQQRAFLPLIIVGIFGAGAVYLLLESFAGRLAMARILRHAKQASDPLVRELQAIVGKEQRLPRLLISNRIAQPMACGVRRPTILLPDSFSITRPESLRSYLVHEWSHIRRGDVLTWRLVNAFRILLWPQPFYWFLRRGLRIDQDYLADSEAASQAEEPADYADLLLSIQKHRMAVLACSTIGMADSISALRRRLEMLLSTNDQLENSCPRSVAIRRLVLLAIVACVLGSLSLSTKPEKTTTKIPAPQAATWNDDESDPTPEPNQEPDYIGPCEMAIDAERGLLYVAQIDTPAVAVIDVATDEIIRRIELPFAPTGLCLSPTGTTLYVTCEGLPVLDEESGKMRPVPEGNVCVIDTATGRAPGVIRVGCGARGPSVSPDGTTLYVCNRFDNDLSVVDLATGQDVRRVPCLREPYDSVVTPDGQTIFVSNSMPIDPSDGYDVASAVTVIDAESLETSSIRMLNGTTNLRNLCVSPDGKYVYSVGLLDRYQMPTTQLERGWTITNTLILIDVKSKSLITQVLLDHIDLGAANPYDATVSKDGSRIYVSHAGSQDLSVIDADAIHERLQGMAPTREAYEANPEKYPARENVAYSSQALEDVPNDLAFLEGKRRRIRLPGNGPRGAAVLGDDVYVAIYFSDVVARLEGIASISMEPETTMALHVDEESGERREYHEPTPITDWENTITIALGPEPVMSEVRRGEMLFNDGTMCFQHWLSCASCHPDGRMDGLNWDIMSDGMGNPKNTSSLLLAHESEPNGWLGVRDNAEINIAGSVRHQLFAVRPWEDIEAISAYVRSMKPAPSPHFRYGHDGRPLMSVAEGRALFESEENGCATCHTGPVYTDNQSHDIGSRAQYDRSDEYYTPSLVECWRTGPYLHDGRYLTIRELLTDDALSCSAAHLNEEQLDALELFILTR
jgi:YVTN family beta-propeller protein